MEFERLKAQKRPTLHDALVGMEVGKTCLAPSDFELEALKRACSRIKRKEGLVFIISTKTGEITITRLK